VTVIAAEQTQRGSGTLTFTPGQWMSLALQVRGPMLQAGAYLPGDVPIWAVNAVDTTRPAAGLAGVRASVAAGNQNSSASVAVDDFTVRDPIGDLDMRVLLRPNGEDDWWFDCEYNAAKVTPDTIFISSDATVQAGPSYFCGTVSSGQSFSGCADAPGLHVTPRQKRWLRWTYEQNTGAGLSRMTFWTSLDGRTWSAAGVRTGGPEPIPIDGGLFALYLEGPVTLSRLEWRDGLDGPLLASPDFAAQPADTTTFSDAQGNVWEVDGRGICAA
jgi:hypothetical protein